MAAPKGHPQWGHRPKGLRNKKNIEVEALAARYGISVFEVLLMIAHADWKGLGFEGPNRVSYTSAGIEFTEPNIKLSDRLHAAKEACKYLYSQKQSVALSAEDSGIRIVVEDYSKKG